MNNTSKTFEELKENMIKENEDEPELDETNKENFNGSFKIIYNEEANIDDFNQL